MRRLLLALLVSCGCAPAKPSHRPETAWTSTLERAHPLVGKIWDTARHAETSRAEMLKLLGDTDYVLLGEAHDNVDHHRLQAAALTAIVARGHRPALAFEMLEPKQQPLVDAFVSSQPASTPAFGAAVKWDPGWPPWRDYAPIGKVAIEAGLPIRAANIALEEARAIASGKLTPALPVWDAELERSLVDELVDEHCGHFPRDKATPMALAQRARDAHMAEVLVEFPAGVLIAGAEHVRSDRGVPYYMRATRPEARVMSVAFVEVEAESLSADAYAKYFHAGTLPFDYVWFTPRTARPDPCASFHAPRAPVSTQP